MELNFERQPHPGSGYLVSHCMKIESENVQLFFGPVAARVIPEPGDLDP